jgi:hypothetical protein
MKTCHVKSGSFDPIERAFEPVNGQPSSDYSKTFQKHFTAFIPSVKPQEVKHLCLLVPYSK